MKNLKLVSLLMFPIAGFAVEKIELRVSADTYLHVSAINHSDDDLMLKKTFAIGPPNFSSGLSFKVENLRGESYAFLPKVKPAVRSESDYITLTPSQSAGRVFSLQDFAAYYGLPNGHYHVTATYRVATKTKGDNDDSKIVSNTVSIELK